MSKTEQQDLVKPSILSSVLTAGTAAVMAVQFTHPIDVIKTRLQIQGEAGRTTKHYNGVSGVVRTIISEEGIACFYKGTSYKSVLTFFQVSVLQTCVRPLMEPLDWAYMSL